MINAYCDSVAQIDYIEINPAVERLAREYFTYLEMCSQKTSVTIGDGRLVLERTVDTANPYQVIVVDAFTDDAIPVHLLTKEAFAKAYGPNLSAQGIVAIHISNKYLNLAPPINGMARSNGYETVFISNDTDPADTLQHSSHWVLVMSPDQVEAFLTYPTASKSKNTYITWTDERSSVLEAFSLSGSVQD
jgi:spermidine synthase